MLVGIRWVQELMNPKHSYSQWELWEEEMKDYQLSKCLSWDGQCPAIPVDAYLSISPSPFHFLLILFHVISFWLLFFALFSLFLFIFLLLFTPLFHPLPVLFISFIHSVWCLNKEKRPIEDEDDEKVTSSRKSHTKRPEEQEKEGRQREGKIYKGGERKPRQSKKSYPGRNNEQIREHWLERDYSGNRMRTKWKPDEEETTKREDERKEENETKKLWEEVISLVTEWVEEKEVKYLPKLWSKRISRIGGGGCCTCGISRISVCWRCRIGGNDCCRCGGRISGATLNTIHLTTCAVRL